MRIGELARETGKSVPTLRYYEQLGLLPAPDRTESGYRAYLPGMVERVRFIGRARERGKEMVGGGARLQQPGRSLAGDYPLELRDTETHFLSP